MTSSKVECTCQQRKRLSSCSSPLKFLMQEPGFKAIVIGVFPSGSEKINLKIILWNGHVSDSIKQSMASHRKYSLQCRTLWTVQSGKWSTTRSTSTMINRSCFCGVSFCLVTSWQNSPASSHMHTEHKATHFLRTMTLSGTSFGEL